MAGKRFILFYQLQSLLKPIPRVSIAFFILYFNPAAFWIQQAKAKESTSSLPEAPDLKSSWELTNIEVVAFSPSRLSLAKSDQGEAATSGLIHEARELYEAGQFRMAVRVWQLASQTYRLQGDKLNEAMTLSSLALAYQQLGQMDRARNAITQSWQLVKNVEKNAQNSQTIAQILNNQGSLQLASGQPEQALITWQKAAASYEAAGDRTGITWSLLNEAQAMRTLGFYRRAMTTLDSVNQNLRSIPDSPTKAVALRSLGNALRGVGDLLRSRQTLEQSLKLSRQLGLRDETDAALMVLGNTARSQHDKRAAWEFYKQAAGSSTAFTAIQAKLNQLSLLIEYEAIEAAGNLAEQLTPQIKNLPAKRAALYAQINFAQNLKKLKQTASANSKIPPQAEIAQLLASTVKQAQSIEDPRAEAYALGCLGSLYEQAGQLSEAKKLTEQALMVAGALKAPDIDYRFSWQLGRIFKAQGDVNSAIANYTFSTTALKSLRDDLVTANPSLQLDFRDQVEPVYRELAALLLHPKQPSQENLSKARDVIEALQVAELNNFLKIACIENNPIEIDRAIDKLDPKAAVIYPIILPDRLEVILKLPGQPLQNYKVNIAQSQLEKLLQELRLALNRPDTLQDVHLLSKQIYDWLILPAIPSLAKSKVKTLVFVLDGSLRQIPMAALYDGQQYLVQKYAIALSPGLHLLPPRPLERVKLKALGVGLTVPRQGFPALPNVKDELNQITSTVPSVVLLNQEFTSSALQNEFEEAEFSIVHLATHGQFSSQANQTFVLAWDKRIFIKDLDILLRSRNSQHSAIELLVLSACQTASGDDRAALGLAGVAVKAGARSTLASLWAIDDKASSVLMDKFYHELAVNKVNKAQALRMAQLSLLRSRKYEHPINWSAFVLLGNWL